MLLKMVIAAAVIAVMAVGALGALGAPAVRADDRVDHARQQVKAADIDYRLGRFTEALDGYTKAYELYPVPALLFNIAQCHKNLKDYAKAIFFFEGYLRDEPKAANRPLVEDLIRESKEQLDRRPSGPANEPVSAAPVASSPVLPPGDPPSADPPSVGPVTPPDPERAPPRSRVLPGVLIGGGLAAAAAGGVFYFYGQKRSTHDKFVYDDTRAVGGAMMAAGVVAVVAGAIWWIRRPASGAPVAALTADAAYAGWAGAF